MVGQVLSHYNLDYIKSVSAQEEDLVMELIKLPKGNYLVFVQIEWSSVDPSILSSFVLSTFSDNHLNLEAADKAEYLPGQHHSLLLDDRPSQLSGS